MPATPLTHADVRRLKLVLEAGFELEKLWVDVDHTPASAQAPLQDALTTVKLREHALNRLISAIDALEQADSENLRRLSFHTRNLSLDMTARHLATVLVPFERLQGKALRDDEILIDEGDTAPARANIAPLRIVADNLRSAFNVGAILRTAECFGVEHVSLAGYTPSPDTDKTARTSLGTEKHVSWSSDRNVHDVIRQAKTDGYQIIALETAQTAVDLDQFDWPERSVLLLGNERFGLDRDVIDQADHIVKIPMLGAKNSLNVGIACGIALASWRSHLNRRPNKQNDPAASHLPTITYTPIAVFRSSSKHPYEAPRQATLDTTGLEGSFTLSGPPRETLKDLEGFDRLWLIYDFHHNKNWKPLVLPPRGPHIKRGVFATRSPYRPNSIGLSCVELIKIEGSTITVRSTDLLDGTPILDVKPYISYADSFANARQGWLEGLPSSPLQIVFSSQAEEQIAWLEANGVSQMRGFLTQQLEFDPTDSERKRVSQEGDHYRLAYRTWRADFEWLSERREIRITGISSGYSRDDLDPLNGANQDDKHGDKDLHRRFIAKFK